MSLDAINIDVFLDDSRANDVDEKQKVAIAIDRACRDRGFFKIPLPQFVEQFDRLQSMARAFFALPVAEKKKIAMENGGAAWRGYFGVGDELTSGRPDLKEGIYFGEEHDDQTAKSRRALHGRNQFHSTTMRTTVLEHIETMKRVASGVLRAMSLGLGLDEHWIEENLIKDDPTVLFRIFHYPAPSAENTQPLGVQPHTDYGLITLLLTDEHAGLQLFQGGDRWLDVAPERGVIVVNLGDMLEKLTGGRYRSTLHRVQHADDRLSFPLFYDPAWTATVVSLPIDDDDNAPPESAEDEARRRWDGKNVKLWQGQYGDYLVDKVAQVFPKLFEKI